VSRIRIKEFSQREPYFKAKVDVIDEGLAQASRSKP